MLRYAGDKDLQKPLSFSDKHADTMRRVAPRASAASVFPVVNEALPSEKGKLSWLPLATRRQHRSAGHDVEPKISKIAQRNT
jgi:hypothetical protein